LVSGARRNPRPALTQPVKIRVIELPGDVAAILPIVERNYSRPKRVVDLA
jgi:hypothetical protein